VLVKASFTQLDDLASKIMNTVGLVNQEMDTWRATSGATEADWLDRAGGEFGAVSAAWQQVSAAQQAMLEALRGGVQNANNEYQQALASASARVASTQI
jgi:hypothetical protein